MEHYTQEDVGNIVSMEHVNMQVPDQSLATLFYVVGLGLTRDPYLTIGLENMWVNAGEQQFHLPTRRAQTIQGHIGMVLPDLNLLQTRLRAIAERFAGTRFAWSARRNHVAVTCPWGNRFRCYHPASVFGDMALGIPYVEFLVSAGAAAPIARFYREVLGSTTTVNSNSKGGKTARVKIGRNQFLVFRETGRKLAPYDGHHIAIYVANFSRPYQLLRKYRLIKEDVRNHQFRFEKVVDPRTRRTVFLLEHEVRSLHHPLYERRFVNRDPVQTQRAYRRGRDRLVPFGN